jgi:hypothetical protein
MFLLLWHSPIVAHDQRNVPDYQPSLVRYDDMQPFIESDNDLLVLWWALNEANPY